MSPKLSPLDAVMGAAAAHGFEERELRAEVQRRDQAAAETRQRQQEAERIRKARIADGADDAELVNPRPPLEQPRHGRRHGRSKVKQAQRQINRLSSFQQRVKRDHARAAQQAEAMADKTLKEHGLYHHYRPLPKVAFFLASMAVHDRNGELAKQIFRQINMPKARQDAVLRAVYRPDGYTPRRDVCQGGRAKQRRYTFDGRELGKRFVAGEPVDLRGWRDGEREDHHPAAIRVFACAIFLWLAKGRSAHRGQSYRVRGFGRGVFESIAGCGKDVLFGHENGLPGAVRALEGAGFMWAFPPINARPIDRGPSGHAYNQYFFPATAEEQAIEDLRARLNLDLPPLPIVDELLAAPASIASRGPPPWAGEFTEDEIPF